MKPLKGKTKDKIMTYDEKTRQLLFKIPNSKIDGYVGKHIVKMTLFDIYLKAKEYELTVEVIKRTEE
jgi:hypothetical protein